ncbi:cupin domain-containing protein [Aureitalea sp. L0-47]|uniref:cupin domain-containing protein n=1 Tax=Aureitalea sp. L0-47 TaxID=2816962 RepID=UPI002237E01F|nr:cupin domain-containing protein [Aureitalea sp. L0-47]MCW5518584.1 cupin domain-containing protein [Aureitalea sp. L0-47]
MYSIDTRIKDSTFEGLKVQKLWTNNTAETLLIAMDEGVDFPEHTSPRDALLIVLEGTFEFKIQKKNIILTTGDAFTFPAEEPHEVHAHSPSKFLIIR